MDSLEDHDMPIYEFKCSKCEQFFEVIVMGSKDNDISGCPKCKSNEFLFSKSSLSLDSNLCSKLFFPNSYQNCSVNQVCPVNWLYSIAVQFSTPSCYQKCVDSVDNCILSLWIFDNLICSTFEHNGALLTSFDVSWSVLIGFDQFSITIGFLKSLTVVSRQETQ